ncbi:sialidase family protein [Verrucomicrobiota bacterium]
MFDASLVYRNEDSYCGPISMLVKLANGEILLVFREAKWRGRVSHMDPTTRTSLLRSRDGGRTWFGQETPDPAGGNGTAVFQLSDGMVIVNAFHWLFAPLQERERLAGRPMQREVEWLNMAVAGGGVFMVRSETEGYTWSAPQHIPEPEDWPSMACHGAVCELPDGELLLPVTGRRGENGQAHGMVLRSRDRGESWGQPACITDDAPPGIDFHETRLLVCPSGSILAMHRTQEGNYFRDSSTDGGRTWGQTQDTGIWCGGSSPPDLRLLADGRVLLSRGYRREPFGVRVYLSEDEGGTWPNEIVLRDDGPDWDVGYPSTVQLDDERLLTVYYWHGQDQIRHLQSTVWELP